MENQDPHQSFKLGASIIRDSRLEFKYVADLESKTVKEVLVSEATKKYPDGKLVSRSRAVGAVAREINRVLRHRLEDIFDELAKTRPPLPFGFSKIKKKRASLLKQRDAAAKKIDDRRKSRLGGDFSDVTIEPCDIAEIEGVFLPIGAGLYKVSIGDGEPVLEHYKIRDYRHFGGNIIHYQCSLASGKISEDFRIPSDFVKDDGEIFMPGRRGDDAHFFWKISAAEKFMADNGLNQPVEVPVMEVDDTPEEAPENDVTDVEEPLSADHEEVADEPVDTGLDEEYETELLPKMGG